MIQTIICVIKIKLVLDFSFLILFSFSTNGQNDTQNSKGLLNNVTETNQLDFIKTENVLPGASLIHSGNPFSRAISYIWMPPGGWWVRTALLLTKMIGLQDLDSLDKPSKIFIWIFRLWKVPKGHFSIFVNSYHK